MVQVEPLQVSCASENTSLLNTGMSKNINTLNDSDDNGTNRYEMAKKTMQLCGIIAIAYTCFVSLITSPTISSLRLPVQWNEKSLTVPYSYNHHHHHNHDDDVPVSPCGKAEDAVFADMHDGDQKVVSIHKDILAIHSASEDESWIVTAHLDLTTCTAMVDFDVPGKPSPPPVPLLVTIWIMERPVSAVHPGLIAVGRKMTLEFTDPSETIAPSKDTPLNHWVAVV